MANRLRDREGVHRSVRIAERSAVKILDELHKAVLAVHDSGRYSEARTELAPMLKELEECRDHADRVWRMLSLAHCRMIQTTGCDASCEEKA